MAKHLELTTEKKLEATLMLLRNEHTGAKIAGRFGEGILSCFSKRAVNLTSIVSRPTRQLFGAYHFFIDFEGHIEDENVSEALREINAANKVKTMGSYPKAKVLRYAQRPFSPQADPIA